MYDNCSKVSSLSCAVLMLMIVSSCKHTLPERTICVPVQRDAEPPDMSEMLADQKVYDILRRHSGDFLIEIKRGDGLVDGAKVFELDERQHVASEYKEGSDGALFISALYERIMWSKGDSASSKALVIVPSELPLAVLSDVTYTMSQAGMISMSWLVVDKNRGQVGVVPFLAPTLKLEPAAQANVWVSLYFKNEGVAIYQGQGSKRELMEPMKGCDVPGVTICVRDEVDVTALVTKIEQSRGSDAIRQEMDALLAAYNMREVYNRLLGLKHTYPEIEALHVSAPGTFPVAFFVHVARVAAYERDGGDHHGKFSSDDSFAKAGYVLDSVVECRKSDQEATDLPRCLFPVITGLPGYHLD